VEISNPSQLPERWLRAYGGLDHPNILGGILALGALFILGWLINASRLAEKGGAAVKRPIDGVLLGCYLILVSGLFVSFSKGAWLGFGIGFLLLFILVLFSKSLIKIREALKILLISGILIFLFFSLYGDLARERFEGNGRLEAKSTSERIALSREALDVIKSRPLIGIGIGNYVRHLYGQKSGVDMSANLRMSSVEWQPVHSLFLLIPAEIGLVGLAILISIIGLSFFLAAKAADRILAIPAILCLLVLMVFDHWLWSLHFGVFSFWLSLGLAVRLGLKESNN
jgi:O-antigen ligase